MHKLIIGFFAGLCISAALAGGITYPPISATACTNQFIRSVAAATGAGTCASVNFASDGTGIVPAANGGAGTVNGAMKANGGGTVSQAACADLSNGGTACTTTYTIGTWTPAVTAGTPGTPTYSTQVGSYEQVGRQVTARFNIVLSGWTGSPSGNMSLIGLPATSTSTSNDFGYCYIANYTVTGLATLNYGMGGIIATSATIATLSSNSSTGVSNVTAAQAGTTPTLRGVCYYRTD